MESISFQIGGYHAPYSVEGRHPDGGGGVLCWAAESFHLKKYRNVSVVKITPEMAGGLPIASENEV